MNAAKSENEVIMANVVKLAVKVQWVPPERQERQVRHKNLIAALALFVLAIPTSASAYETDEYAAKAGISTAQAEYDLKVQASRPNIVGEMESLLGENYGGLWFNAATGKFAARVAYQTVSGSWWPMAWENEIEWGYVARPMNVLRATQMQMSAELPKASIYIAPQLNNVVAESSQITPSVREVVRKHHAILRRGAQAKATSCSGGACAPERGGAWIRSYEVLRSQYGYAECSAGFVVGGGTYLLTAGHCLRYLPNWSTGYCELHRANARVDPGADVGILALGTCPAEARTQTWENPWRYEMHVCRCSGCVGGCFPLVKETGPTEDHIASPARPYVGEWVCKYGRGFWHGCGEVWSTERITAIEYDPQEIIAVAHTFGIQVPGEPGTSGGPIEARMAFDTSWEYGGIGWDALALGITVAGNYRVGYGYEIGPALSAMGVSLP